MCIVLCSHFTCGLLLTVMLPSLYWMLFKWKMLREVISCFVCVCVCVLCIKSFLYCMGCAHGIDCCSHSNIICLFWWVYDSSVTGTTSGADGHVIILCF